MGVWGALKCSCSCRRVLIVFNLWIEVWHGAADTAGNNIDVAVDLSVIRRLEVPCMNPPGDARDRGQSGSKKSECPARKGPSLRFRGARFHCPGLEYLSSLALHG